MFEIKIALAVYILNHKYPKTLFLPFELTSQFNSTVQHDKSTSSQ